MKNFSILSLLLIFVISLAACQAPTPPPTHAGLKVLATESFIADISQNVAGERFQIDALLPKGIDPHAFEPTPADIAKIAAADVIIINGGGVEEWLQETLESAGGEHQIIEASHGLKSRTPIETHSHEEDAHTGEEHHHEEEANTGEEHHHEEEAHAGEEHHHEEETNTGEEHHHEEEANTGEEHHHHHEGDPHFWLDPNLVITYVENIRSGLSQADPQGNDVFNQNAAAYTSKLKELDAWIQAQVSQVPAQNRLLVTNHESLGYFADRYGFKIVGAVIPSVSTNASPSAQQVASLVDAIKSTGAKAVFLETGANPQVAKQVASEAGVKLVTDLYTHSITEADGKAPTYIDMMKYNTTMIVDALK